MISFNIDIKFDSADIILKNHGLQEGGPLQAFFTNEVIRYSGPYVPGGPGGMLAKNITIWSNKDGFTYNSIYSKYMWNGKLMVDPKYKIGAFHNALTGRFWSRKGIPKELTDIPLKYHGGPLEGPKWIKRMWADKSDDILKEVQSLVNRGVK